MMKIILYYGSDTHGAEKTQKVQRQQTTAALDDDAAAARHIKQAKSQWGQNEGQPTETMRRQTKLNTSLKPP